MRARGPLPNRQAFLPLLSSWALGPRGTVGPGDAATALSCMSALAGGVPAPVRGLSRSAVIDLVADAVEIVAEPDARHPWLRGITALEGGDCPGVRDLLMARAAEGSGRCDEARLLIGSCLRERPAWGRPSVTRWSTSCARATGRARSNSH